MIGGHDLGANVDANPANHLHVESVVQESEDFMSHSSFGGNYADVSIEETASSSDLAPRSSSDRVLSSPGGRSPGPALDHASGPATATAGVSSLPASGAAAAAAGASPPSSGSSVAPSPSAAVS
jgi:hypothetical protein